MSSDSQFPVASTAGGAPTRRVELDNLIRRELRVDPNDPAQVAQALMKRYAETPTARSLVNEAKGLPFLQTVALAPPPAPQPTATTMDLQQAKHDIEADLKELLACNQLKDIAPELEGWASAIRAAVDAGERAAVQGMDTRQRDKTFEVRRYLGDYARAARLVGTFQSRARDDFRSLAQSLDEAAAVLLVMLGEAIANTGISGGRYLLQGPFGELQARREAVLYALRNLTGRTEYGPNDWPRGVDAYRQLFDVLERHGHGELRSLLTETEMARVMDGMIARAGHGVAGLRALGSTALLDLQRFQRLVATIAWRASDPESPALVAMHEALQLFIDGFRGTGGSRLVGIARPSILMYGLYGTDSSRAEGRLRGLVQNRGLLAQRLDCMAACACNDNEARWQALLDKCLYQVDRAIDLYAVGTEDLGLPEVRAAAYGMTIQAVRSLKLPDGNGAAVNVLADPPVEIFVDLASNLVPTSSTAWEGTSHARFQDGRKADGHAGDGSDNFVDIICQELSLDAQQDAHLQPIVRQMGDGCDGFHHLFASAPDHIRNLERLAFAQSQAANAKDLDIAKLQAALKDSKALPPSGDFELLESCSRAIATWGIHPDDLRVTRDLRPSIPSTIETSGDGRAYGRERTGRMPRRIPPAVSAPATGIDRGDTGGKTAA